MKLSRAERDEAVKELERLIRYDESRERYFAEHRLQKMRNLFGLHRKQIKAMRLAIEALNAMKVEE